MQKMEDVKQYLDKKGISPEIYYTMNPPNYGGMALLILHRCLKKK